MTRDEWLVSDEGRRVARASELKRLIRLALFMGDAPKNQGRTIGQVYVKLAAETDYALLDVVRAFDELYRNHEIYIANEDADPLPAATQWRNLQ